MKWTPLLMFTALSFLMTSTVLGQQAYVSRYDAFAGYTFLDSPRVGLFENGFQFQAGVRPKTWYSLGFDYSISAGDLTLTPNLLTTALQQQLAAQLQQLAAAGLVPAGFTLSVPAHSKTQTFAAGPQLAYRHFSHITLLSGLRSEQSTRLQLRIQLTQSPRASRSNWCLPGRRRTGPDFMDSEAASTFFSRGTSVFECRPTSFMTICSAIS